MKTYSVWIEVEEHDQETEQYETVEGLDGAAVAIFADPDEAIAFGNRLQQTGEQLATEHDTLI